MTLSRFHIFEFKFFIFFSSFIFIVLYIYWPGLNGPFMFDDFPNFERLSQLDQIDTSTRIKQYIFSGSSGPSGRPISLLSFMINDNAWPSQPSSFLYTNLLIHVLNSLIIFLVIFRLCQLINQDIRKASIIAGITAFFWACHPLQVSTVLYIVQRMTMLATLFTLAAILGYISGRAKLTSKPLLAYTQMTLSISCFGLLGFFSKETGALLLIYILVIEYFLLRPYGNHPPIHFRYWQFLFLWLPNIVIFGYFLITLPSIYQNYSNRDFTLIERLLTQSRVILEYLYHILIPKIGYSGLFHDDYAISKNMLSPPVTLFSIFFNIGLIFAAIKLKKKIPFFSFAVFWFLGGHIMESTIISLEIYFEHRNYLPMLGPVFAIVFLASHSRVRNLGIYKFAVIMLLTSSVVFTYHNTTLWGQPWYSSAIWASEHPASMRAQQFASAAAAVRGENSKARQYLINGLNYHPNDAGLILQLLNMDCSNKILTPTTLQNFSKKLATATYSNSSLGAMKKIVEMSDSGPCELFTTQTKIDLISTLIKNPHFNESDYLQALYYWLGILYSEKRDLDAAINSLDIANNHLSIIDIPLQQAVWLYSAGLYNDALEYVDKARSINKRIKNPFLKNTRSKDIENLENIIQKSINNSAEIP